MDALKMNVVAPVNAGAPTYVRVAKMLAPVAIAAPLLANLWLLSVLPWGWALALVVVSVPLAVAVYGDVRDLYTAPRYGRRDVSRAALKTYAWAFGFLPGLMWMLAGVAAENVFYGSEASNPNSTHGQINPWSGWAMADKSRDINGNLEGFNDDGGVTFH